MSLSKKIFGYFLIVFSFSLIILIGFPQVYSNNAAGRIDKTVKVESEFLKDEDAEVVLLYFGYVGCKNICTPAMNEISTIYKQLQSKNVKVYFLSLLDVEVNTVREYAMYFNKDFKGLKLPHKELEALKAKLRVQTTSSFSDANEINHAGHLYVLERDKKNNLYEQKYIYTTRPLNTKVIIEDIKVFLISKSKD